MSDKDDQRSLPVPSDKSSRPVQLHDNGVRASNLIDKAISSLGQDELKALGVKASEEVIKLQARQNQQNIDYVTSRKTIEDHVDTWDKLDKRDKLARHNQTTEVNTGTGKVRIESKSGLSCFVATAAYEDPTHPDVEFLRWYRDNSLNRHAPGRAFIRAYWAVGPHLARVVTRYPKLRAASRDGLSRLVRLLRVRSGKA